MTDVVIRVENITGAGGRPLDELEADALVESLATTLRALVERMAYAAAVKATRHTRPDPPADRHDPTAGELAHIDAQAGGAHRRAWHEDEQL